MNRKVLATITEYDMLQRGDRVFVAVSGGADSVALLHVLHGLQGQLGIRLVAMHLNHNLRGAESLRDERHVRRLCRRMKVPLIVRSLPVARLAKARGQSVEECARDMRYRFFADCASGKRDRIATAHTRSDLCETVLLNLTRGTGLRGLCGIPPVRQNIVRPLIDCSRNEVETWCTRNHLHYVTDSTNLQDKFTRNRLRLRVLPVLKDMNPRLEEHVAAMARLLRADADCLDDAAVSMLEEIALPEGGYDRTAWLDLPQALQPRVLRVLLTDQGLRYDRERLQQLEQLLQRGFGAQQLSPDLVVRCTAERFLLQRPGVKRHRRPPAEERVLELFLPAMGEAVEAALFPGQKLRLSAGDCEYFKNNINIEKNEFKNLLDYDRIEKIAKLRTLRPADAVRLAGRGCTKSLKKLWGEAGIPLERRRTMLALADAGGILWVEQFGTAERAAPGPDTTRYLSVELMEE